MNFNALSFFIACFFFLGMPLLQAQTMITKNFKFDEGVYLSLEALQKNKPDYSWKDVSANLASNPQTYMAQLDFMKVNATGDTLKNEAIYALSLGGIPFIRLKDNEGSKELTTFAGLQVRGYLSYFTFEKVVKAKKVFSAYNPINGKPFITKTEERKETVIEQRIMNFKTGEIYDFTQENLMTLVQSDKELSKAVSQLKQKDLQEKLFKSLLIFDDRHSVYVVED